MWKLLHFVYMYLVWFGQRAVLLHCVLYFSDIVNGDLKSVILYLSGLKNYNEKVSFYSILWLLKLIKENLWFFIWHYFGNCSYMFIILKNYNEKVGFYSILWSLKLIKENLWFFIWHYFGNCSYMYIIHSPKSALSRLWDSMSMQLSYYTPSPLHEIFPTHLYIQF